MSASSCRNDAPLDWAMTQNNLGIALWRLGERENGTARTTTAHARLMLTMLGGLAEFERELIRARTGEGRARAMENGVRLGPQADAHPSPAARGDQAPQRGQGNTGQDCTLLQCQSLDDFEVD